MLPELTNRENEVLEQTAYGYTNREIANILAISESTVENHLHHIFVKLSISNRAQAVAYAFQSRIVLVDENIEEILHDEALVSQ